jgi:hypothetical protein
MKLLLDVLTTFLRQNLLGGVQTFAHHVQIVIAVTKLDEHFPQSNQMLNLTAQSASMPTAQFIKFSPLLVRHSDVKTDILLCHSVKAARVRF